jgi:hypothetical protein
VALDHRGEFLVAEKGPDTISSGQLYTYGDHNRLLQTSVRDLSGDTVVGDYTYDGRGQRVSKTAGGVTIHYVYGLGGELLGEYPVGAAGQSIEYVYLHGQPIAVTQQALETVQPPALELILDNGAAGTSSTGTWQSKTATQDYGVDYRYTNQTSGSSYRWSATPPGLTYDVYAWWVGASNQSASVTYTIRYGSGETATVVKSHKSGGGQWQYLGSYYSTERRLGF